ncbi:MAG: YncE family protein [Cyanobium sp.]
MARVIATVPTGINPQHMAITPDSRFAYVANNNNGIAGEDSVTVINLRTNQAVATIRDASFSEPYTVTINPRGTLAYVTNSTSSTVSVINLKQRRVETVIGGFDGPSGMVIHGKLGYVNNYGAGQVWPCVRPDSAAVDDARLFVEPTPFSG